MTNQETRTLGQTLLAALEAKGLTQATFAKKIGKTRSTVHGWCRDKTKPRLDTLSQIASGLDTTVAELMAGRWRKPRAISKRAAS